MARADQRPGRRRAVKEPKSRLPFRRRATEGSVGGGPAPRSTAEPPRSPGRRAERGRRDRGPAGGPPASAPEALDPAAPDPAAPEPTAPAALEPAALEPAAPEPAAAEVVQTSTAPPHDLMEHTGPIAGATAAATAVAVAELPPLREPGEPVRSGTNALPVPETVDRARSRGQRLRGAVLTTAWLLLTLAGAAALGVAWTPLDFPAWLPTAGAVTITTAYTYALAVRTGGRPLLSGALALVGAGAAVGTGIPELVAGIAVMTAVVTSVLGVMATKPAARFVGVVREVVVALLVTAVGALAVEAYQAEVSLKRLGYLALGLSLLIALVLVYRLGAGFHGLGRRGAITVVSGLVLLGVSLAYTEAFGRWGSQDMVGTLQDLSDTVRARLGAVPRPIEVLVGFPALAWGISTRARRRQGWWVSAFGAAGLAVVCVSLVAPTMSLVEAGLTLLYSAVLGLLVGYLVIRADTFLSGARGRRARRLEEAAAHRPEPGRTQPLL